MEQATRTHRRRFPAGLAVPVLTALAIAVAGVAIALVIAADDEPSGARQLGDVRRSCEQWIASGAEGDPAWCTGMTDWMRTQMRTNAMSPQMMWGEPGRLLESCQQWMDSAAPTSNARAGTWCSDMAAWMAEHMSGWMGWSMGGPMMGGPNRIAGRALTAFPTG